MFHKFTAFKFTQALIILVIGTQLLACGGGGSDTVVSTGSTTSQLSGSVGDGPIVGGTVTVKDKNGKIIATAPSDASANYSVSIEISSDKYPLIIEATGGTDLVTGRAPDFMLSSILFQQDAGGGQTTLNINPFTTLIYQTAAIMPGGASEQNVNRARQYIFNAAGFGLDPKIIADPATTPINAANIAMIVKSSEALAEMFRRTHEIIRARDSSVNIEDVIAALAADLSDGVIDGQGAAGTQARISATATIVSAQVLIESLGDNLKVDGSKATASLNNAIVSTRPAATVTTVPNNAATLAQARATVAAASAFAPSIALSTITSVLESVQPGTSPKAFNTVLPADTSADLNNAINAISVATNSQIDAVNDAVRDTSNNPPQNSAPVISGSPATSVTENTAYSFKPVATDANGDRLTFNISNKPVWASFNSGNGRLSGIPGNGHAGVTSSIVISVSDGEATIALPRFSISVSNSNDAPVIAGSPETSVTAGGNYNFAPTASDADGDKLTFSIRNKPAWASFSTGSGRLSGVPVDSHVGSHSNIVISVTDGADTVSLPVFSIQVSKAVPTGSFSLGWTAPATRSDGMPLSLADINGYRLYYGASTGIYPDVVEVSDGTATSATVTGVPLGINYVVMTTTDSGGRESVYSQEVSKIVQ